MADATENQPEIAQTDKESQEFGVQHGQDITGHDSGTSSPTVDEQKNNNDTNAGSAVSGDNEELPADQVKQKAL